MEILQEYIVVLVMALCLGVGFIIKHSLDFIPNKYIPLILAIIGVGANVINEGALTLPIVVGGVASALASVGTFELVKNLKSQ